MSTYLIRFTGKYEVDDDVQAVQAEHTFMVKGLAETVDPNAQGSFGIDQVEKSFSATVTGAPTGDGEHLNTVRTVFEAARAALEAIDATVAGAFSFTDDDGVVTTE